MDFQGLEDVEVLEMLAEERLPLVREPNDLLVLELIGELTKRGVYPKDTVAGNPNSVFAMVEGWGARWHEWPGRLECPHCKAELRDLKMGPPFKREIAITDRGLDRVTHFICPECNQKI